MGHYSIRKKVRDARKKIAASANKNNFKYELAIWRQSIDKPQKSKITGEYTLFGSVGLKRTCVICNHGNIPKAAENVRKDYLDSFENHNGNFKQPKRYYFSQEKYIVKSMSHMKYLQKLAWHKMNKWDRKHPIPDTSNLTDIDKQIILKNHQKLRSDIYSHLCTTLLQDENKNRNVVYYKAEVIGSEEFFMKDKTLYCKNFKSRNEAEKALLINTTKYMRTDSGTFNKQYRRSNLYKCIYNNGTITTELLDYHTIRHTAMWMWEAAYSEFIKNLKLPFAGGTTIPFKKELAYVA